MVFKSTPKHILVIHTAFIGDVVLVTPLIVDLKRLYPDASIDVMVTLRARPILDCDPHVDGVIVFDKRGKDAGLRGFMRMASRVRREGYDWVVSPHRSLRSALLAWWSRAPIRIGFDTSAGRFLFNKVVAYRSDLHEIDRNRLLLSTWEEVTDPASLCVHVCESDRQQVDSVLKTTSFQHGLKTVALAPGSVWQTKRWPLNYFQALVGLLVDDPLNIILLGGTEDRELTDQIAHLWPERVINLAGGLSLRESAEVIRRSTTLVTNDSAPMHLGAAVKTPVIALFGPTVPSIGFAPQGDQHIIIEKQLDCRPCSRHGGPRCPLKHHNCMRDLSPRMVYQHVKKVVEQT